MQRLTIIILLALSTIAAARNIRGRIVTKEVFDSSTSSSRELASAPLVLARNGAYFEAQFGSLALPAQMTAKISFSRYQHRNRYTLLDSTSVPGNHFHNRHLQTFVSFWKDCVAFLLPKFQSGMQRSRYLQIRVYQDQFFLPNCQSNILHVFL